jgi:tetratricopeptide (TPR) repeat protein
MTFIGSLLAGRASLPPKPPLERVNELISYNKIWDAYSLLNELLNANNDLKLVLLRAECESKMGLLREAIRDCSTVLESPNSDPTQLQSARRLRGACHLQFGDLDSALSDATAANDRRVIRQISEARQLLESAESPDNAEAKKTVDRLLRLTPRAAAVLRRRADIAWAEGDHARYLQSVQPMIDDFPEDSELNLRTGLIYLCRDELLSAEKYLSRSSAENAMLAKMVVKNISDLRPRAAELVEAESFSEASTVLNATLDVAEIFCGRGTELVVGIDMLRATVLRSSGDKAALVGVLGRLIDVSHNESLFWERGKLHMDLKDFDAAVYDFTVLMRRNPNNKTAIDAYDDALMARKNATRIDLYAVLGVRENASQEQIEVAYKSAVRKWHPDRFQKEEEKTRAENMMKVVNQAREILTHPEKRALYDLGGDSQDLEILEFMMSHREMMPEEFGL